MKHDEERPIRILPAAQPMFVWLVCLACPATDQMVVDNLLAPEGYKVSSQSHGISALSMPVLFTPARHMFASLQHVSQLENHCRIGALCHSPWGFSLKLSCRGSLGLIATLQPPPLATGTSPTPQTSLCPHSALNTRHNHHAITGGAGDGRV